MDIILLDSSGVRITNLPTPMEICLDKDFAGKVSNLLLLFAISNLGMKKRDCLGFFNETSREWQCEDDCPITRNNELCGKTDHLTNFAMLLQVEGTRGPEDPCASSLSENHVYQYLTIGFTAGAICCCLIASIFIELYFRWKQIRHKIHLRLISREQNQGAM